MRYLLALAIAGFLHAAPPGKSPDWGLLQPLIGNWVGEGGGGPGQGSGSFSFQPDLQGKVLTRKNHAEYPATTNSPAYAHDDLMIVYRETPESALHAIYFDNEGHVIRYEVVPSPDAHAVIFRSEAKEPGPHYRLTYTSTDNTHVKIKFDIAPPGQPDGFKTYIEAVAHRSE